VACHPAPLSRTRNEKKDSDKARKGEMPTRQKVEFSVHMEKGAPKIAWNRTVLVGT